MKGCRVGGYHYCDDRGKAAQVATKRRDASRKEYKLSPHTFIKALQGLQRVTTQWKQCEVYWHRRATKSQSIWMYWCRSSALLLLGRVPFLSGLLQFFIHFFGRYVPQSSTNSLCPHCHALLNPHHHRPSLNDCNLHLVDPSASNLLPLETILHTAASMILSNQKPHHVTLLLWPLSDFPLLTSGIPALIVTDIRPCHYLISYYKCPGLLWSNHIGLSVPPAQRCFLPCTYLPVPLPRPVL